MTHRRTLRLPSDINDQVGDYQSQHNLTDAEAGRIAYLRLLQKPPTKAEREAAEVKRGNPNFGKK